MHPPAPFSPLVKRALRGRAKRPQREQLAAAIAAHEFTLLDEPTGSVPCACGKARRWSCLACDRSFCVPCPHTCLEHPEPMAPKTCGEAAQLRAAGSPPLPRGRQPRLEVLVDWLVDRAVSFWRAAARVLGGAS